MYVYIMKITECRVTTRRKDYLTNLKDSNKNPIKKQQRRKVPNFWLKKKNNNINIKL